MQIKYEVMILTYVKIAWSSLGDFARSASAYERNGGPVLKEKCVHALASMRAHERAPR